MGGQLVFAWDRLENFLITRDRPVGNIVTNTKCQRWVSHVQMQCRLPSLSKWCTDRWQKCPVQVNHDCCAIIDTFAALIPSRQLPLLGGLSFQCKIRCNPINQVTLGDRAVESESRSRKDFQPEESESQKILTTPTPGDLLLNNCDCLCHKRA